jgi:Spy/CpxP family protein refolding chaperone
MLGNSFHRRRFATLTAAAFALAFACAASGQPVGPGYGPGGPHHGMTGPGGEEMIGPLIARARANLNLNTSQSGMFDAALAQSKAARETGRALHQKVRDALAAELAKPEPDLAAVAAVADGVREQGAALHKEVRAAWLALYATFSPEQKAVVKDMLQQRLARIDAVRQRMQQRLQERAATQGN